MTVTKKHVKYRWVALGLLLAVLVTSFPLMALADGSSTLNALDITSDDRAYDWVTHGKTTYTYDFSATDITVYSKDEALATSSLRTNMIFDGQTLSCKEGKTFSFSSSIFLGDDYGLYGGEMSVDAVVTGGKVSIGTRLSRTATDAKHRGIWFSFDGTDTVTVSEPESRLSAAVKASKPASVGKLTVKDKASVIELYLDGTLLCSVAYDSYTGGIAILDAHGNTLASKDSTDVRPAGYNLNSSELDWHLMKSCIDEWEKIKGFYDDDYYLLSEWNRSDSEWTAWEFYDPASGKGFFEVFRPANATDSSFTVQLKGLKNTASYKLTDTEGRFEVTASGSELKKAGYTITLAEAYSSAVVLIEEVPS